MNIKSCFEGILYMKYHITTFGCQMNKSDSERIAHVLESLGYKPSLRVEKADLIVVNMCSVRQSAVDRVFGYGNKLKKLKKENPKIKTVLTGCIIKKDRKKLSKYFDYILEIKDLPNWPKILSNKNKEAKEEKFPKFENYLELEQSYSTFPLAYIPISTGCDHFCTYCVVPYTRGREVYKPADKIICEIKNLVKKGYKEIWLLGQKVNSYKCKFETATKNLKLIDFADLLKMVNDIPGKFWIRFTSPHPNDFTDKLIKTMKECEKITPYLNLPVQSGDNEILKKMKRTDIIVGFPGETKKQFENTKKLMEEIGYDMAYIAQFSPRAGTVAAKMDNNVTKEEKERREKVLTEILKRNAFEKNKEFVGKVVEVLPTEEKKGYLFGKSFHYKTVKFKGEKELIGKFCKVKIKEFSAFGLKGELVTL